MSGLGDDQEVSGDSDRHSREGEELGMGRGRGVRGNQAGVLMGYGRGRGRGRIDENDSDGDSSDSDGNLSVGRGAGRGRIDENSQRRDYEAPGRGRGFLASGDSDGNSSVGRGAGRGRIDENGQRSYVAPGPGRRFLASRWENVDETSGDSSGGEELGAELSNVSGCDSGDSDGNSSVGLGAGRGRIDENGQRRDYVAPGPGRRFLASRRENVDETSGDSSGGEELGAELSNVSGCVQKVKCFKCKKEGHKSTECQGPDRSKYSYEVCLLPRERMDTPQNEDSTTVDTYQEDADRIKIVFEKALEYNPTYESVKKFLCKDSSIKSVGGRLGMVGMMIVEVGQNFHLIVNFVQHSTIHMKTKRAPITKSLQGLSAAKIAQTLMDQGRSQPEDADKLKLPDRLKNVVKNYL